MAKVRVALKSHGMSRMLNDPAVGKELVRRADGVASRARNSALVETGEYKESIFVVSDVTDRVVARVGSRAPHGMIVEAMTGNLARALGSAE